ncbi:MAG: lamin tail domain-containing protein [Bacteroidales bacterium]|nr:lamin tail domain-containing protein [Bacteroidales bacterium]
MKKVILLIYLLPCLAYGQIVEDFEPGNLFHWRQSADGRWKADTSGSLSGGYSLHHVFDNTVAGTDQIGLPLDSLQPDEGKVTWSFIIRHGYDPSSSNSWAVFLMSDTDPSTAYTSGTTNGYALGVNLTGYDDTLRLWKIIRNEITPVVNCKVNWQNIIGSTDAVRIIAERTTGGNWTVSICRMPDVPVNTASGLDTELFTCSWFVISYTYTSGRDRLLWFDELHINGIFHEDEDEPDITAEAETGDVVISEIMADPEPVVSLPDGEYIEITNRRDFPFNLKNWKITAGEQDYLFPEIIIKPSGTLIICSARDTTAFARFGKVIGLKQFPALTDNGKLLLLFDSHGTLIHGVDYSSEWYNDELKSKGGWSLEMIDTGYPFFFKGNWTASESRQGGTPGKVNSVSGENPDNQFTGDLIIFPEDSLLLSVRSPEPLFDLLRMTDSIKIDDNSPLSIDLADPLYRKFYLRLSTPLEEGEVSQFDILGDILDFAGNKLPKNKFFFGLTVQAESGDILFNELLFNPLPGDPDYLEFFNPSQKIIDASRLGLVSVNDDSGDTSQICMVSQEHKCILPGKYYAVTTSPEEILMRYFTADPECLSEISDLPSMSDDEGHLILYSRELIKIDELSYSEKMHAPLLSGYEGIALEKINPASSSEEEANWHSASESSGWGTPGAKNSVWSDKPAGSDMVNLSSSRITPDADGFEDVLVIDLRLTGNSNIVSVTIFDEWGSFVRKIAENMYVGPEATLIWEGAAEDGSMVDTGIYIVLITMYDEAGKTRKWKKVCTVIRR